jgi:hypothetical protein
MDDQLAHSIKANCLLTSSAPCITMSKVLSCKLFYRLFPRQPSVTLNTTGGKGHG